MTIVTSSADVPTGSTGPGYWPHQLPRHLDYPSLTVGDLNAYAARTYPDRVGVRDGDAALTFAEIHAHACQVAHGLRAAGVRERDVVVLHQPNSLWFLSSYYGILLAGATVAPTNPLHPAAGLRAQIEETGAVAALSHPQHLALLEEARQGTALQTVVVAPGTAVAPGDEAALPAGARWLAELMHGQPTVRPEVDTRPDDIAHLAYTGGTTGVPKAVRVLHRNVVANVTQMAGWRAGHLLGTDGAGATLTPLPDAAGAGVVPGDSVTIVVSPMFHAHALINASFLHVCGTRQVLTGRFDPERMLELIEQEQATYITGSPTMWHALVGADGAGAGRDFSSLRVVSSGAAPIDLPTMEALQRLFPATVILEGYGLTEGTCLVSVGPVFRDGLTKPGSVGVPMFDTEVDIRGTLDGAALPTGERGELWVRGPQVTDGYFERPDATAQQFVDGWLNTGDIAYVDEDGFLFICDRAKDMLIYKGYNVYPRELEDLLVAHPDVDSAAVVGREHPAVGQEPIAFVVPTSGHEVDPDVLMAYVAEHVLPYKKVRGIHVVDRLPSNPAGKILKTELRERANEGETHA